MRPSLSAGGGGGGRAGSPGDGALPSAMSADRPDSAKRKARATSDTLSERLLRASAAVATRSRPEWNDGDLGMPSGDTARRGLDSAAASRKNIARADARAGGPAWTMAGGRQRHPEAPAGPGAALGSAGLPPPPRSAARTPAPPRATPAHVSTEIL